MPDVTKERASEEVMWAGPSGELWLANATLFEKTMQPIADALIERARLSPGERVIDVGCGAGAMSLEIAARVGERGSVTGLDISPVLVAEATRRAGATHPKAAVRFVLGDAAHASLPTGETDCLVSRFGIMFFTDPYAAFSHMHGFLRTGGRLALACWAPMQQNSWMMEVRQVLAAHFDLPAPPPRIPGPFAFAEPEYLRDILTKARFKGVEIVPWQGEMYVGGPGSDPELATDFLLKALSIAQRAIEATEEVRQQVRTELRERLRAFATPNGVRMAASAWLATAAS